jgi:hypothetical protein
MNRGKTPVEVPAATLRKLLTTYFNDAELQVLAHDLGVDYEELGGDNKTSKSIQLIQYAARHGKLVDLVELCRKERPDVDWNAVGIAAATHPEQFTFVPDDKPLLNASPDRALKLGLALGALMVALLGCGFGGGLLAGQIIDITINPVQPDPSSLEQIQFQIGNRSFTPEEANVTFDQTMQALTSGRLPPDTPVTVWLDNVQATTIADELIEITPTSPVTDAHIRFLEDGQIVVNVRLKEAGERRIVLAYTAESQGGRIVLTPTSGWLNLIEIPGTTFGWAPLPQSTQDAITQWAQALLDNAARNFYFEEVQVTENQLKVAGKTR